MVVVYLNRWVKTLYGSVVFVSQGKPAQLGMMWICQQTSCGWHCRATPPPPPNTHFTTTTFLLYCWLTSHTVMQVVIVLATLLVGFPGQTFAVNMLVIYFVVVLLPTKEINLQNINISPEISVSNLAQLVLISSIIEPHIKVIVFLLLSAFSPSLHSSMWPCSQT